LRRLATGRNLAGKAAPLIRADGFVAPCIRFLTHKPRSEADWMHGVKHDGCRLIVRRDGAGVRRNMRKSLERVKGNRPPRLFALKSLLNL
jgi:ATP-dependent DNA ligase